MRALFLTGHLKLQATAAAGAYARQGMFMSALLQVASGIDVLYFAHHDPAYGGGPWSDEDLQGIAERNWGPKVSLRVCRRDPPRRSTGVVQRLKAATNLLRQPGYASTAGDLHRRAFVHSLSQCRPDLIFVHRLGAMSPVLRHSGTLPPVFFDLDDVEHVALRRTLLTRPIPWRELPRLLELPALLAGERAAIQRSTLAFVCSELDAERLRRQMGTPQVESVPNGVPLPNEVRRGCDPVLLMVGNYAYGPNKQGLERFVSDVWPSIRSTLPAARLRAVGPGYENLAFARDMPAGVECLGYVDDLATAYASAAVVVCPIYSGSGTRVKIVEAAAHGLPIVTTPIGAEGLAMCDGRDIAIVRSAGEFAGRCLQLLRDRDLSARLGDAARRTAEDHFDREAISRRIAARMVNALRTARSSVSGAPCNASE